MKHALVGLMMIGALPAAAAAQDIGGRYTVHGTNFDGSAYSGEADIKAISAYGRLPERTAWAPRC